MVVVCQVEAHKCARREGGTHVPAMYGAWCRVHGILHGVRGLRCMMRNTWLMMHDPHCTMEDGTRARPAANEEAQREERHLPS